LDDLNAFKLQNRVDQKFIFRDVELDSLLNEIAEHYKVLTIDNTRIFRYNTLYFDTPNLNSYFDHHNGKPNRCKIRYRKYEQSGDVFFEIKKKIKGIRTNKFRVPTIEIPSEIGEIENNLLESCLIQNHNFKPSIWVNYDRITLISKDNEERVTIDLHVEYKNDEQTLLYYCRSCGSIEVPELKTIVASKTTFRRDNIKSWNHIVNKYTKLDPTLFRDSIMQCPNEMCETNTNERTASERQIIHLRYDEDNMKYLYLCFHCDYVWNTEG
jgi:aspartate carbamoyltransferase regulatory subunit